MRLPRGLLLALSLVAGQVHAEVTLQVGITGSNRLEGMENPVSVAQIPAVSELLQAIADEPRGEEFIRQSLQGSEVELPRLLALGLVKPWQGKFAIAFNYITLEDHALLLEALSPHAESLAQAYRDHWAEFDAILSRYDARAPDRGAVAFVVLGAISLDWDGLDVTAEKNLRITAKNLPAGREFILWAKEQSPENNVKGLYWGTHNETINGIRFTSFGDHHTFPRLAFPDLAWSTGNRLVKIEGAPRSLKIAIYEALKPYYTDDLLTDVGAVLSQLRRQSAGAENLARSTGLDANRLNGLLSLLQELQYVHRQEDRFSLTAPFFSTRDKTMLDAARKSSRALMEQWLEDNYDVVEDSLSELTALRYGVPYRQVFTEIWHYLFGMANRSLVASGHFADPYDEQRVARAIIPFAFEVGAVAPDEFDQ